MSKFQPSINIVYDTGNPELFSQFVPNLNQIDILTSILDGIINHKDKAHLLIGPYGAGKSMVGAMVASLISFRKNSKDIKNFKKNVDTVSPDAAELLEEVLSEKEIKWIPITITGNFGKFDQIILDAIVNQLKENNISFSLKGDQEQILKTVSLWECEYPDTYSKFDYYCVQKGIKLTDMMGKIKLGDENCIIEFKKIYPHLTSGAVFLSKSNVSFIDQIEYLLKQLRSKKIGIFLVYDEFGRFLQTVNQSDIYQTMQNLQDLSESANRTINLSLLFITHTGLRQYALSNNSLSKSELERVEKRFVDHRLDSDPSLFFRTAFIILESIRENQGGNLFLVEDFDYIRNEILKYNLFPEMSPSEIDGAILEGCQPIHPLTIRLLPALSNILGQNDRTLYTFLVDSNNQSRVSDWFYADQLFDYFYPDESTFYLLDELRYFRTAMSYRLSENAKRLIKLVTLINIVNQPFSITNSFLQFALGQKKKEIDQAINELTFKKIIRFNRFSDSYELYSGSLVEMESLFDDYKNSIIINDQRRINTINQIFKNKYYLPLAYNNDKSMTRYVEVQFSWINQLNTIQSTGDGVLAYILYRSNDEYQELYNHLKEEKKENLLICIPLLDIEKLMKKIDNVIIVSELLNNKELLKEDVNLKSEIETRMENLKFDIEQLLKPLQQFDEESLKWIFQGEELTPFKSKEQLESFISDWMYERYPHTLEIRNEGFNKRNITSMQRKAAIQILDDLLKPTFDGDFSISGFGPDYLIYAAMFKHQGYNFSNLDQLANSELKRMRNDLKQYIQVNPRGNIFDLFQILLQAPYGMREPVVPILVVSLLKDYWNQMAFYSNDLFVSNMNADLMYQILEQKAEFYKYEIYKLTPSTINVLEAINHVYFENQLPIQPAILFSEMTEWLRTLPRYTQITEKQPDLILNFKAAIRHSETDPLEASYRVERMLSENLIEEELNEIKSFLEEYLTEFTKLIRNEVLTILSVEDWHTWSKKNSVLLKQTPILQGLYQKVQENGDWLSYLIEKTVGVKIKDWSDITYDSFITNVKRLMVRHNGNKGIKIVEDDQALLTIQETDLSVKGKTVLGNLKRIVEAGGRTMSPDEVKYIVYLVLKELES